MVVGAAVLVADAVDDPPEPVVQVVEPSLRSWAVTAFTDEEIWLSSRWYWAWA